MPFIPEKQSKRWFWVAPVYFIILLVLLCIPQVVLHAALAARPVLGLAVLSAGITLLACGGGYLGGRLFATTLTSGVLAGAVYMLYITVTQRDTGWADLAGLGGFLSFAFVGLTAGLLLQLIVFIRRKAGNRARKPRA